MSYDNELRGVLFKNKQKRDGKQDADYRGSCEVGGVAYYLDAWVNTPKAGGEKFMALKFKEKQPKPAVEPEPVQEEFVPDADIPF
jgi:hypothetical protein